MPNFGRLLRVFAAVIVALLSAPLWAQGITTNGTDFWLTFTRLTSSPIAATTFKLYITSTGAASGQVSVPGLGFNQAFTTVGNVAKVEVPFGAQLLTHDQVQDLGIHVTADSTVWVYGVEAGPASADAYVGFQTAALGTDHMVLSYPSMGATLGGSTLAVVATVDNTAVTITPSANGNGGVRAAGVPYSVTLNRGQTYQFISEGFAAVTGSTVSATQPVAVFAGSVQSQVPAGVQAADILIEQVPPLNTWGTTFVTNPLKDRPGGDTYRVLAAQDGTEVRFNGALVTTLNQGAFFEGVLTAATVIETSGPALVARYANSNAFDGTATIGADPFMAYLPQHVVTTPDAYGGPQFTTNAESSATHVFGRNDINLVVPANAAGTGPETVQLNGAPIPPAQFTQLGSTAYYTTQLDVPLGTYQLQAPVGIGVVVYGFGSPSVVTTSIQQMSYGFSSGYRLAPLASALQLTVAPSATLPVNQQVCVNATVTNAQGQPMAGVSVDFAVAGANPGTGSAVSNANGVATYCYTGTVAGPDTVTATSGAVSASTPVTWARAPTPVRVGGALPWLALSFGVIGLSRWRLRRRAR